MIFTDINSKELFILFNNEQINFCRELAKKRCKRDWGDKAHPNNKLWRGGGLNDPSDTSRTERLGLYGEKAFSLMTGIPVDETISESGDKWDFAVNKLHIEVKASQTIYQNAHGNVFMKATNDFGKIIPLRADYYFFTSIGQHNGTTKNRSGFITEKNATELIMIIHGYIAQKDILMNIKDRIGPPVTKKTGANWLNYYIKPEELCDPLNFIYKFNTDLNLVNSALFL